MIIYNPLSDTDSRRREIDFEDDSHDGLEYGSQNPPVAIVHLMRHAEVRIHPLESWSY
jgi:hypothetical protein